MEDSLMSRTATKVKGYKMLWKLRSTEEEWKAPGKRREASHFNIFFNYPRLQGVLKAIEIIECQNPNGLFVDLKSAEILPLGNVARHISPFETPSPEGEGFNHPDGDAKNRIGLYFCSKCQ
jgi:hypothetical protein